MKRTFKRIAFAALTLALLAAWTVWTSERLYRYGYNRGRVEYLMDDKERYGVREWLEKHPEEQIDLELPEIYRELRQFDKTKELLEKKSSRTHFTNEMLRRSKWKDSRVFMVTG